MRILLLEDAGYKFGASRVVMEILPSFIIPGEARRRQLFYLSKSKLGHVAQLATLMSGFGVRSVVNLQINEDPSPVLLTAYVVITTLLVVASSFVILVTLWIVPLLHTAEKINQEIEDLLQRASQKKLDRFDLQRFAAGVKRNSTCGNNSARVSYGLKTFRSDRLTVLLIEVSWILVGTVAVALFTVDVIVIHWIKYREFSFAGPVIGTIILVSVLVALGVLGIYFRFFVVEKFRNVTKPPGEAPKASQSIEGDPRRVVWWPHHNVPSIDYAEYTNDVQEV